MPDVKAQLVISAVDQASATMRGVGGASKDAGLSITDLYSAVRLAEMGFRALKGAYDDVVNPTVQLADQTRKLQRDIGASAEDAGKLIYAANTVGINVDAMAKSFDMAINKMRTHRSQGIEPNIDGLGILADKYNAIQDPIARTQFLMDNFGRSGANLAPLLALGSTGIKNLGDQAQAAGVVMDQQAVTATYDYEKATKALDAAVNGLKISIGEKLIPSVTALAQAETQSLTTHSLIEQAVKDGIITNSEAYNMYTKLSYGVMTQTDVYNQLMPAIKATAQAAKDETIIMADNIGLHKQEAAALKEEADKEYDLQRAMLDSGSARDVATEKYAKLIQATRDQIQAQQDAVEIQRINAFTTDSVTKSIRTYQDTVKASQPEIVKLTDKIADMTAANGLAITTVVKGKVSQEDYNIAVERAQLAQEKYQVALAGTVDKHGKLHQANNLTLEGMRIAAEAAQNQVDKLSQKMGSATTSVADYSTAIADAQSKLNDLQQKESDAEAQLKKTTGQFLAQQLALDMKLTPAMTLQLDKALGLINQKEYDLGLTVLGATKLWDLNKNGVIDAGLEYDKLTAYLADQQAQVVKTTEAVPPLTHNISDVGGAAHHAMDEVNNFSDAINNIPTSHTTTITTIYGGGGPGYEPPTGGGGGGSNVPVIPPSGGGGGGGYINPASGGTSNAAVNALTSMVAAQHAQNSAMPSMIARAVRDALQQVH